MSEQLPVTGSRSAYASNSPFSGVRMAFGECSGKKRPAGSGNCSRKRRLTKWRAVTISMAAVEGTTGPGSRPVPGASTGRTLA